MNCSQRRLLCVTVQSEAVAGVASDTVSSVDAAVSELHVQLSCLIRGSRRAIRGSRVVMLSSVCGGSASHNYLLIIQCEAVAVRLGSCAYPASQLDHTQPATRAIQPYSCMPYISRTSTHIHNTQTRTSNTHNHSVHSPLTTSRQAINTNNHQQPHPQWKCRVCLVRCDSLHTCRLTHYLNTPPCCSRYCCCRAPRHHRRSATLVRSCHRLTVCS